MAPSSKLGKDNADDLAISFIPIKSGFLSQGFRHSRVHDKCALGPDLVVLPELDSDGDLGLFGAVEPFGIQRFPTEGAVEAFAATVLP